MAVGMIERMARALYAEATTSSATETVIPPVVAPNLDEDWKQFIPAARAVITAMREPTEGMAVDAIVYEAVDGKATSCNVWRAMIDAATADT